MGLSVIAACLPTLAPLFRDLSADEISQRICTFFTLRSRSSGALKSVSQTNIVRKIGAENNAGFETIAMGNFESENMEREGQDEGMNGQIFVTTGLNRHSSLEAV